MSFILADTDEVCIRVHVRLSNSFLSLNITASLNAVIQRYRVWTVRKVVFSTSPFPFFTQLLSHWNWFQTRTELQLISWKHSEGLYVRTQISWSVAADISQSFSCQPLWVDLRMVSECELMWEHSRRTSGEFTTCEWACWWGVKRVRCKTEKRKFSGWKRGAVHAEGSDEDVNVWSRRASRASGDKRRLRCWCAINKNKWSPQQNLYFTSCLLCYPTPEPSGEFCNVENTSDQKTSSCILHMWKANCGRSLDPIVWAFSRVPIWKWP